VVGVLAVAIASAPGGSSTVPPSPVLTAPLSTAATAAPVALGPRLRPTATPCALRGARLLRVLQFNIHFGVGRDTDAVELATLASEIEAVRPDLVSLNEVDSGAYRSRRIDEAGYLAGVTGLRAVYGPNLPWQGGRFGNAILTRFPVVASRNLRLPGLSGLEPRGLLTTTLRIDGATVSFSSVHLSDGPSGRTSRILQARAVAAALRDAPYPTILAGDLNSMPRALPVRILRQDLLDAQVYGGTGRGDTIPESTPRSRIDYALYDDHLAVVPGSTRVLPSASSDHRSVFTELALLPRRGC
jgi:endonuclease/exonuclease/phosphatase family metal-dependent hydrolase